MPTHKKSAVAHMRADKIRPAAGKAERNGAQTETPQMQKAESYKKSSPGKAAKPMMGKGGREAASGAKARC